MKALAKLSRMVSICPPSSSSAARSSSQDELCLAGSSLMEAMLGVNQDVVVVKVRCYSCADYVFHFQKLPTDQCQGDGLVV